MRTSVLKLIIYHLPQFVSNGFLNENISIGKSYLPFAPACVEQSLEWEYQYKSDLFTFFPSSCRTVSWMRTSARVLKSWMNRGLASFSPFSWTSRENSSFFVRQARAIFEAFSDTAIKLCNNSVISTPNRLALIRQKARTQMAINF